eukprot:g13231.t1
MPLISFVAAVVAIIGVSCAAMAIASSCRNGVTSPPAATAPAEAENDGEAFRGARNFCSSSAAGVTIFPDTSRNMICPGSASMLIPPAQKRAGVTPLSRTCKRPIA